MHHIPLLEVCYIFHFDAYIAVTECSAHYMGEGGAVLYFTYQDNLKM
jgi:hypothetical protein